MTKISPLNERHDDAAASFLDYGGIPVVETFGELEAEYAAIRKGCLLLDQPTRATVTVRGGERREFLNRMLTQELADLESGQVRRTFWLNRKGRIDADIRLLELDESTLFDLDVMVVEGLLETLGAYLFAEDVEMADDSEAWHRLALHGPTAPAVLEALGINVPAVDQVIETTFQDATLILDRADTTGSPGIELLVAAGHVEALHSALIDAGVEGGHRLRSGGWHAWNIARIEAGTPIFNIDFGTNSLPHETGVLLDRVSFTKGCYLGQEVVARMESLGHPKQRLVSIRVDDGDDGSPDLQPVGGTGVFDPEKDEKPVGAVTSSTRSPMLGDQVICFGQVKWSHSQPGQQLRLETGVVGTVQESLPFWTP